MDVMLERIISLLPTKPDGSLVHGARTTFAKSIGAPSNIFAEWIAGRNNSYRNYLYQIAAKYGVSVEWLKGETDEKSPAPEGAELSEETMELILKQLSPAQLADLMGKVAQELKERGLQ